MGQLLESLCHGSPMHRVETSRDGVTLIRLGDDRCSFDGFVRVLLDHAGPDYAAFPVSDPVHKASYERVYIIPLE